MGIDRGRENLIGIKGRDSCGFLSFRLRLQGRKV